VKVRLAVLVAATLLARPALGHTAGESFFELAPATGSGRFEVALRDLDDAIGLDQDGDGRIRRAELDARQAAVVAHVTGAVVMATAGPCAPQVRRVSVGRRGGAATAVLDVALGCPPGPRLTFESRLFFPRDGLHRAFVTLAHGRQAGETHLLRAESPRISLALGAETSALATTRGFVLEGVLHIWQGLDHVLFLVVLLLPAVLHREGGSWVPAASLAIALRDVVRVVTAFTLAHSITLALAALGALRAAPAIIEPAIAASVVLAAVNNLVPVFGRDRWVMAFALGLLHGFGFSSVLAEIGLPRGHLMAALFGFNLGVELGQLALVLVVVPLAFIVRRTVRYRRLALWGGSALAAALAAVWLVERVIGATFL
jgi:hypothetical protein